MPRAGHGAGERGGHRGRAQRARELPRVPPQPEAVDDADHRVRRPAGRRPGPAGLAGFGQGDAAQLDRPVRGRAGAVRRRRRRRQAIEVFTTRPDTLFGATYMVLAPEHPLVEQIVPGAWPLDTDPRWTRRRDRSGHDASAPIRRPPRPSPPTARPRRASPSWTARRTRTRPASSPAPWRSTRSTGRPIPVFVADYVLMGYGTGAIMAVPGQDQRDWDFADGVRPADHPHGRASGGLGGRGYTGDGPAINSHNDEISLDGLGVAEAKRAITDWLVGKGAGEAGRPVQAARLAVLPAALLGRAVPDRLGRRTARSRCPTTSCPSSCPRSTTTRRRPTPRTPRTPSPSRRWPRAGLGERRAGPGRRAEDLPARDEHDAAVGRLVLVLPALPGPARRQVLLRARDRAVLDGADPARPRRPRRRRPVRRRRRARRAAPAVRAVLAQGAVRPGRGVARRSRSGGCSTRATSRPTPTPTPAAPTCRPRRSSRSPGGGFTWNNAPVTPGVREDGQVAAATW